MYNSRLARALSKDAALLISHFLDIRSYENMPEEFYQQKERIMYDLAMSRTELDKALKILIDHECLKVTKKGLPAKNYYSLNDDKLIDILSEDDYKRTEYSATREPSGRLQENRVLVNAEDDKYKEQEESELH